MIGKSLFIGERIEFTALNAEKDAEILSAWTKNLQFSKRFFETPARQYAVFELKKKLKEDLKKADEKRNAYIFAVRKKGETDLISLLKFGWLQPSQQAGRLFLDFSSAQCLAEYGDEIVKMALRYAFMELSLHRLWVEVSGHDLEEISLYEGAGFIREIQRREAAFFDGRYYDQMVYSLLKPEWKKLQQEVSA